MVYIIPYFRGGFNRGAVCYNNGPHQKRWIGISPTPSVKYWSISISAQICYGNQKYRVREARASTYTNEARQALIDVWNSIGCPCPEYLQVQIADYAQSYSGHVACIKPKTLKELLKMSASTMTRILKKLPRKKLGCTKANKRSGKNINNPVKAMSPCRSGETILTGKANPGNMQMDTFALCGGNPCDNFFWALTGTDRKLQWTVLAPTWNRGQNATVQALASIFAAAPFPITSLHSDNESDSINSKPYIHRRNSIIPSLNSSKRSFASKRPIARQNPAQRPPPSRIGPPRRFASPPAGTAPLLREGAPTPQISTPLNP